METLSQSCYLVRDHFTQFVSWLAANPGKLFYGVSILSISTWLILKALEVYRGSLESPKKPLSLENPTPSIPYNLRTPKRPPGKWVPVKFQRPAPKPYPDWNVHTTKPLPYRPFRNGPYHITMGLRTMRWDEWIELDSHFFRFHADKARRIQERGDKCCKTAPEAFEGAVELLEEL